jgi:hypothetical protein
VTVPDYRRFYDGRRVLITGGPGFIGSNLAHVAGAWRTVEFYRAHLPHYVPEADRPQVALP